MAKLKLMDKGIAKKYKRNTDKDNMESVSLPRVLRSIYPAKKNYSEKHRKLFRKFLEV